MKLRIVPISFNAANRFVASHHRHHKAVVGCKFCVAIEDGENIRGVAIVGRPVARCLDNGFTVEVNRCCTDGVKNGCSMLYGAARRVARELGYLRVVTYIMHDETGASLRAAGFKLAAVTRGGEWSRAGRLRLPVNDSNFKLRWEMIL